MPILYDIITAEEEVIPLTLSPDVHYSLTHVRCPALPSVMAKIFRVGSNTAGGLISRREFQ